MDLRTSSITHEIFKKENKSYHVSFKLLDAYLISSSQSCWFIDSFIVGWEAIPFVYLAPITQRPVGATHGYKNKQ